MPLSADDLAKLAAAPVAASLYALDAEIELNPEVLEAIERFPRLADVRFNVTKADDALLGRLGELRVQGLWLHGLDPATQVGEQTATMLRSMKLTKLTVDGTKPDRRLMELIAAMPKLERLNVFDIDDDLAAEFARCQSLRNLWVTQLSDAGLEHLKGLTNLRELNVATGDRPSKITDAAAKKLAAALPLCKITYKYAPGGTIEPRPVIDALRPAVAALVKAGATVAVSDSGKRRDVKSADEFQDADRLWGIYVPTVAGKPLLANPAVFAALNALPVEAWDQGIGHLALGG